MTYNDWYAITPNETKPIFVKAHVKCKSKFRCCVGIYIIIHLFVTMYLLLQCVSQGKDEDILFIQTFKGEESPLK